MHQTRTIIYSQDKLHPSAVFRQHRPKLRNPLRASHLSQHQPRIQELAIIACQPTHLLKRIADSHRIQFQVNQLIKQTT